MKPEEAADILAALCRAADAIREVVVAMVQAINRAIEPLIAWFRRHSHLIDLRSLASREHPRAFRGIVWYAKPRIRGP